MRRKSRGGLRIAAVLTVCCLLAACGSSSTPPEPISPSSAVSSPSPEPSSSAPSSAVSSNDLNSVPEEPCDYWITSLADYVATDANDLYQYADLVLRGTYESDVTTYVNSAAKVVTRSKLHVTDVLKGTYTSDSIPVDYYGGSATMGQYLAKLKPAQIKKLGYDSLSALERTTKRIGYIPTEASVSFDKKARTSPEYLLFLSYNKSKSVYFVLCDGYGAREVRGDSAYNLDKKEFNQLPFLKN